MSTAQPDPTRAADPVTETSQTSGPSTPRTTNETSETMDDSDPRPGTPLDPTQAISATNTTALPHLPQQSAPYRVEPATPVPDDRVVPEPTWAPPTPPVAYGEPGRPLVTVSTRPRPGTVLFGLVSMVIAGYVLLGNLTSVDLDVRTAGPHVFGAVGGLLLVGGLVGVLVGRRRR